MMYQDIESMNQQQQQQRHFLHDNVPTIPLVRTRSGRRLPTTPAAPVWVPQVSRTAPTTPRSFPGTPKQQPPGSGSSERQFSFRRIQLPQDQETHSWGELRKSSHYSSGSLVPSRRRSRKSSSHRRSRNHRSVEHICSSKQASDMRQPLRSQSFKCRPRPTDVRRSPLNDTSQRSNERRRSTPNITRRFSQKYRPLDTQRTDVWPEPKTSVVEERFLNLPDSEDYTRVRQFNIDEKGAVVSRGDSFRLRNLGDSKRAPRVSSARSIPSNESDSSRSTLSGASGASAANNEKDENNQPSTSASAYKIYVLGATGVGKTALIGQFMTSDYRNTYATDIEQVDNTLSIVINDKENELTFYEADPHNDDSWLDSKVDIYLLVYSIDSKSSFKQAMYIVERLRQSVSTRHMPIVMAANKVDLERKRAISKSDARNAAMTYGFVHYEVSVALNLEVDDLLVGLVAEIKESLKPRTDLLDNNEQSEESGGGVDDEEEPSDFKAAIRRYSKRKRGQMIGTAELKTSKCTLFKTNLMERFRNWRHSLPKLQQ